MHAAVQVDIKGSRERIWQVIADIENSVNVIGGIEKIEILEKPEEGILGLKWRETRTMFGKEATEVMWITEAEENGYYATRAESHGSVYITQLQITGENDSSVLSMEFRARAQSVGAKILSFIFSGILKKSMEKALRQDLEDIKAAVEAGRQ